jgi:hypothetical protein
MLFSPEPKTRREDLYDFNRELSALVTALRAERPPPACRWVGAPLNEAPCELGWGHYNASALWGLSWLVVSTMACEGR